MLSLFIFFPFSLQQVLRNFCFMWAFLRPWLWVWTTWVSFVTLAKLFNCFFTGEKINSQLVKLWELNELQHMKSLKQCARAHAKHSIISIIISQVFWVFLTSSSPIFPITVTLALKIVCLTSAFTCVCFFH